VRRWFGLSYSELKNLPSFSWNSTGIKIVEETDIASVFGSSGYATTTDDKKLILLKSKDVGKRVTFLDANNTIWQAICHHQLSGSLMFKIGPDGKVLGKRGVVEAVLNMAVHIIKGCFDLHSEKHGLEFFQNMGKPLSKGPRAGLVVCESAVGQNELEAHNRITNFATSTTTMLGDPELAPRLYFTYLYQNHQV